jgi:hypothetical protein
LPLNFNRLTGEGRFESDIFIPSACENIRFIFHVATTNAAAYDLIIDDFIPELVPFTSFNNMSDWVDAGPLEIDATTSAPTKGTTTVDRILYRYVGDSVELDGIYIQTTAGTAGSGDYEYELPADVPDFDESLIFTNTGAFGSNEKENAAATIGTASIAITGTSIGHGFCVALGPRKFGIVVQRLGSSGSGGTQDSAFESLANANMGISFHISAPVVGRTSGASHPAAIGLNAKAELQAIGLTANTTANVAIGNWETVNEDSLGAFNATTGVYTVKSPGSYWVNFGIVSVTTGNTVAAIRLNGTIIEQTQGPNNGNGYFGHPGGFLPNLKYGDEITVTLSTNKTFNTLDAGNYINIFKIGSEQQPYAPRVAYLKDTKVASTDGGTFTSGAWQTRDLNRIEGDESFVSVSANQFVLEPGTYDIDAMAPALSVNAHKAKLRDITNSSDILIGHSAWASNTNVVGNLATIMGRFTISAATTFEIQHRCEITSATFGFGSDSNFGVDEVYTQVKITKIL